MTKPIKATATNVRKTTETTTRKKSAVKPVPKPAEKTAAAAKSAIAVAPKPVVVQGKASDQSVTAMRKKELIETVTERSGIKKRDAKPVVEAMLAVLGQTLADGREMNLQPLGKIKVNRKKDVQGGTVIVTKVRQSDRQVAPKDPLAKAAE